MVRVYVETAYQNKMLFFLLLYQAGRIEKFDEFAKDFMANQVRF